MRFDKLWRCNEVRKSGLLFESWVNDDALNILQGKILIDASWNDLHIRTLTVDATTIWKLTCTEKHGKILISSFIRRNNRKGQENGCTIGREWRHSTEKIANVQNFIGEMSDGHCWSQSKACQYFLPLPHLPFVSSATVKFLATLTRMKSNRKGVWCLMDSNCELKRLWHPSRFVPLTRSLNQCIQPSGTLKECQIRSRGVLSNAFYKEKEFT